MSLTILGNSNYLGYSISSPFLATGGTSPYTYSIAPDGVGGTISPSGLYTAPNKVGTDKIIVTDSLGQKAVKIVNVGSILHLICDVIQNEMSLEDGRVYIFDQKKFMPTDEGVFVAVSMLSCKPFANNIEYDFTLDQQVQSSNFFASLQLDIISKSTEALLRKEELLMAMKSTYAEQQQELNSFHIGVISTNFVNLSQIDGTAIPYRFSITVNVQYQVKKIGSVPYFDSFEDPSVITSP